MLDRVVERPGLADLPLPGLAADPEGAAGRHDQRQMDDRPDVADAGMGRKMASRAKQREEDSRRAARQIGERQRFDHRRRLRRPRAGRVVAPAVLPEMQRAPVERVVERRPFILGRARLHRHIGQEAGILIGQQRFQFGADDVRPPLDLLDPRKMAALEKLLGRKEGIMQAVRIDWRRSRGGRAHDRCRPRSGAGPAADTPSRALGQPVVDRRSEAGLITRHPLAGVRTSCSIAGGPLLDHRRQRGDARPALARPWLLLRSGRTARQAGRAP